MIYNLKKTIILTICLCLSFIFSFASLQARPLDDIIDAGQIKIFVYENFPPFSFKQNGKLVGIDVEIGRLIAKEIGVKPYFIVRDGDENVDDDLRNNIWKGTVVGGEAADLMMHVPFDRELEVRNELIAIFGRYFTERMGLLFNTKIVGKTQSIAVFRFHKIGAELDTIGDFYLSSPSTFGGQLRKNVVHYRDLANGIKGLKKEEVGGFIAPASQLEYAAKLVGPHLVTAHPPMFGLKKTQWDLGVAVKTDSRDLGYKAQNIIRKLRKSGTIDAIFKKYGVNIYRAYP